MQNPHQWPRKKTMTVLRSPFKSSCVKADPSANVVANAGNGSPSFTGPVYAGRRMANRAHHWKPTSNVIITTAVQRQMERERMSARIISARPKVPRIGPYQFVIRILAANVSKKFRAYPPTTANTPRSSKERPGCCRVPVADRFSSFMDDSRDDGVEA